MGCQPRCHCYARSSVVVRRDRVILYKMLVDYVRVTHLVTHLLSLAAGSSSSLSAPVSPSTVSTSPIVPASSISVPSRVPGSSLSTVPASSTSSNSASFLYNRLSATTSWMRPKPFSSGPLPKPPLNSSET